MPTVRNYQVLKSYWGNALKYGFDLNRLYVLFITEDFADKKAMKNFLRDINMQGEVFGEEERRKWFKEKRIDKYSDLIPKRSHAETSFGLLYVWAHPELKYVFFIDDDTEPTEEHDYFGGHLRNLNLNGKLPAASSSTKWVNVLFESFKEHGLYPRGFPYLTKNEEVTVAEKHVEDVYMSQGLWLGDPDLDAISILNGNSKVKMTKGSYKSPFTVERGNYTTICSMNLAFRRNIIPYFYQLPMDSNPFKIGRFDDIWSGVIAKKIMDSCAGAIINGFPLCRHTKATRNVFKDLVAEVAGLEINEVLWKIVDDTEATTNDPILLYESIARKLENGEWESIVNGAFLKMMGKNMLRWIECVTSLG